MSKFNDSEIAYNIIELLKKQLENQINKGVEKYGHTLDDCPIGSFRWYEMLNEELVDALQYSMKESKGMRNELKELREENLRLRATMDNMYSTM